MVRVVSGRYTVREKSCRVDAASVVSVASVVVRVVIANGTVFSRVAT
jgi:hypothetical protein